MPGIIFEEKQHIILISHFHFLQFCLLKPEREINGHNIYKIRILSQLGAKKISFPPNIDGQASLTKNIVLVEKKETK